MNKGRSAYIGRGLITTGLGMAISWGGHLIGPSALGAAGLIIGLVFMFSGMTWLFWGGK